MHSDEVTVAGPRRFATTRWSVVLAAGGDQSEQADRALAELCADYWYPLYAYVRRRGYQAEDARDLTQAFFAKLLEKNWVAAADRERGKFRTFMLTALKHYMADEWDRQRAQKRGGGKVRGESVFVNLADSQDQSPGLAQVVGAEPSAAVPKIHPHRADTKVCRRSAKGARPN